jgi:hypothetical protein
MRDARTGHVIRKLQGAIPGRVPIERARAEAERAICPPIPIDPFSSVQEYVVVGKQLTVMIQVVDVDLEPTISNLFEEPVRDWIPFLRHDLEGGLDPDRIIQIHELRADIPTGQFFDIVGHHRAAGGSLRPKPNERHSVDPMGLHGHGQQSFEDAFDCSIHRPLRKGTLLPIAEAQSLKALPNGKRQEPTKPIVEVPDHWTMTERGLTATVVGVAFVTEVLDDFVWIEGKANCAVVDDDIV